MDSIDKFFLPPCPRQALPPELINSGERPVLHLLRRDLQNLYLEENKFGSIDGDDHKAPYLAAMGILTGIDLMASFYSTEGRPGVIFKKFLLEVCAVPQAEAIFTWKFRNALHHSYSLDLGILENTVFTTEVNNNPWHTINGRTHHIVNLWGLKRFFFMAIEKFKVKLAADQNLLAHFEERYRKSGRIFVLNQEKHPT